MGKEIVAVNQARGFTLAEVLIALAILGEIAAFTIPKIVTSQQLNTYRAIAKEAAGTIAGAYQIYSFKNSVTATTNPGDLVQFINYAAVDTTSTIDSEQGGTSVTCSDTGIQCLRLHNGAILWHGKNNVDFGGTTDLNAIYLLVDPDAKYSGSATGQGKSVKFYLYRTGRVATWASITSGTVTHEWGSYYVSNPDATRDPPWFDW
jgi:prepilin-type N-terminal cleavage/methylation domain-containing protein